VGRNLVIVGLELAVPTSRTGCLHDPGALAQ